MPWSSQRGLQVASRGQFSDHARVSCVPGATEDQIFSCVPPLLFSYNSCVPVESRVAGVDVGPVTVGNVICSGKEKYLFALRASGSVSKTSF
jgi:hypothetical protein